MGEMLVTRGDLAIPRASGPFPVSQCLLLTPLHMPRPPSKCPMIAVGTVLSKSPCSTWLRLLFPFHQSQVLAPCPTCPPLPRPDAFPGSKQPTMATSQDSQAPSLPFPCPFPGCPCFSASGGCRLLLSPHPGPQCAIPCWEPFLPKSGWAPAASSQKPLQTPRVTSPLTQHWS